MRPKERKRVMTNAQYFTAVSTRVPCRRHRDWLKLTVIWTAVFTVALVVTLACVG